MKKKSKFSVKKAQKSRVCVYQCQSNKKKKNCVHKIKFIQVGGDLMNEKKSLVNK